MAKYRIVVEAIIEVDDEMMNCPYNGVVATAQEFAMMAIRYKSIGAIEASVLHTEQTLRGEK